MDRHLNVSFVVVWAGRWEGAHLYVNVSLRYDAVNRSLRIRQPTKKITGSGMDQPHPSYSRGSQDKTLLAMTIGQAFDHTVAQYPEHRPVPPPVQLPPCLVEQHHTVTLYQLTMAWMMEPQQWT